MRTMDEISCGENVLVSFRYSTCTIGLPSLSTTLKGHDSISFLTVGSSNLRPISRLVLSLVFVQRPFIFSIYKLYLISKIVFAGFIAAWFFADSPINRSSSVNETNEGVVKLPCSLATSSRNGQHKNFHELQDVSTY